MYKNACLLPELKKRSRCKIKAGRASYKRVYNMQGCIIAWLNTRYSIVTDADFWAVNDPNFH